MDVAICVTYGVVIVTLDTARAVVMQTDLVHESPSMHGYSILRNGCTSERESGQVARRSCEKSRGVASCGGRGCGCPFGLPALVGCVSWCFSWCGVSRGVSRGVSHGIICQI